jgi:hypothetical protein
MSTADEFRQNAEDCRKQSDKALGAAAKASWLKVAEDWLKLGCGVSGDQSASAIVGRIEAGLDHPELQQAAQLPPAHWTTARAVTARE